MKAVRAKNDTPDQGALVIFDVFKGHMDEAVQTLLEENRVIAPNNCTDLFQPLDLSVNKPFKDKLRRGFSEWYTEEVAKQLQHGKQPDEIHIDTRMSVVKELSCKWIMSGYDHIRSSPEIVRNGFKKAGIISAIEDGVEQAALVADATLELDKDPFDSDDV